MTVSLRPTRTEDEDALIDMMRALYAHDGSALDEPRQRQALRGLLAQPDAGRVWLIEADGQAAGYVVLTLGYSLEYRGRDALVDELYLRPAYRDRGLGQRTLALVEAECCALGVHALHLEVERANIAAQAAYHRFGFFTHSRLLMTKWIED